MRGITPCIKEQKFKSKKAHIDTRGTEKAEFMKGDPNITNIIEASMYDTKTVH